MSYQYKTGDKVRFINEAMEGMVSKIFSDSEVEVRDENGFQYRVKIFEIVPVHNEDNFSEKLKANSSEESVTEKIRKNIGSYFENFHSCFLCVVPEIFEKLLHSSYSIVMVNASEEFLLYSLHLINNNEGISSFAIVNPKQEMIALELPSDSPLSLVHCQLNYIIHSSKNNSAGKTGQRKFSLTPDDFLDENLFLSRDLFHNHILAFDINATDELKIPEGEITKLVDHFTATKKNIAKKESTERKRNYYQTNLITNEKTIDLHIEELTDNYNSMSNSEMLNLQLNLFRNELDQAILHHYYRIIFIHGKGNGTLKNSIRKELDTLNLKYGDADTAKFGFGATEVLL